MPWVESNGLRIAYEMEGKGEPLVLIRGYASAGALWYDQVPDLARHFRVVRYDNRGTGESDKPDGPYSIGDMAKDLAGLLDGLGLRPAYLLGISMGGMIALQAALDFPDAVRKLVLGCTTCDGRKGITRDPEVLAQFATLPDASDEENVRRSVPVLFSEQTIRNRPEVIERHVAENLKHRSPHATYLHHQTAISGFNVCDRLGEIVCPTLILHGEGDLLISPDEARKLHRGIPGSRIRFFPGLGHLFFMEDAAAFNGAVIDFLKSS